MISFSADGILTIRGRRNAMTGKPNTGTVVRSSGHLTLTGITDRGQMEQAVFSDRDPISGEIFGNILSGPNGDQAVPA